MTTFWSKAGGALSFFYGVLAGISPWIFTKIKEQRNKNLGKNNNKNR
jgi:hypothetical protein